jgi:hypothetical protein
VLTDGSGSSDYGVNLNCSWLLQAPSTSRMQVNLTSVALESSTPCNDW